MKKKQVLSWWLGSFWANINCCGVGCDDLVARAALKRKKQHEHSLEQTNGQINMLEQQIYSIESANINQETLLAMKNASAAMKQIHGRMTMEDVDVTMYVLLPPNPSFLPQSSLFPPSLLSSFNQKDKKEKKKKSHARIFLREQLREQHELTQEIGNAITSMPITEPVDEDELQADLDKLEQEALDEKMLRTGTVPVADSLSNRLPAGPTGASTSLPSPFSPPPPTFFLSCSFFLTLLLYSPAIIFAIPSLSVITSTLTKAGICVCGFFINSQRQIQSGRRRRRSRTCKTPGRDGHVKLGVPFSLVLLFAAALVVCGGPGRWYGQIGGEDWWEGMDRRKLLYSTPTITSYLFPPFFTNKEKKIK